MCAEFVPTPFGMLNVAAAAPVFYPCQRNVNHEYLAAGDAIEEKVLQCYTVSIGVLGSHYTLKYQI